MNEQTEIQPWGHYYQATQGGPPRPLFLEALRLYEVDRFDPAGGLAIDLGCGDGTETLALLARGWTVLALDQSPEAIACVRAAVPADWRPRLHTQTTSFQAAELPPADLVYAGLSLPFCPPEELPAVWARALGAVKPGGRFAGHFFGRREGRSARHWANQAGRTLLTLPEARALFAGLTIEFENVIDEVRPTALHGPRHTYVFEMIARKP
jgi:SAM-dependent methyltransferase